MQSDQKPGTCLKIEGIDLRTISDNIIMWTNPIPPAPTLTQEIGPQKKIFGKDPIKIMDHLKETSAQSL